MFAGALLILAAVAYSNSLDAPFVLDDKPEILNKATIKPPVRLELLLADSRPLVAISLAANYALGGVEVWGYHLLNLLLHAACGVLLFALARYTFLQPVLAGRYESHASALAFVAASLFLLHPIQTESVTYTIQRAEILSAIWLLVGIYLAARAARTRQPAGLLVGLAVCGVLGIASKPSFVVLPVLFAIYDWCFIAEGKWREMLGRRQLYLLLGALAVGAFLWGLPTEDAATAGAHQQGLMKGIGPWRYLTWQFGVLLYYLQLVFVPDRLCFDCGYLAPWTVQSSWIGNMVWLPAALLAGAGLASWLARPVYPLATLCVWASAVALAPTSTVMPLADVYVEHRLYLPIAFLSLFVVALFYDASEWVRRRGGLPTLVVRAGQVGTAVAVGGVLMWMTFGRNEEYSNLIRLFEDAIAKAPMSRRLVYNLGNEYAAAQQPEKAIAMYQQAIRIDDSTGRNFINMGVQYQNLGRYAEAAQAFEEAAIREPNLWLAYFNQSMAYEKLGDRSKAIAAMEKLVEIKPGNGGYQKRLGVLYQLEGRNEDALRAYEAARRVTPADKDLLQRIAALGGAAG